MSNRYSHPVQVDLAPIVDAAARAQFAEMVEQARKTNPEGKPVEFDALLPGDRAFLRQAVLPLVAAVIGMVEDQVRGQLTSALDADVARYTGLGFGENFLDGLRAARSMVAPADIDEAAA